MVRLQRSLRARLAPDLRRIKDRRYKIRLRYGDVTRVLLRDADVHAGGRNRGVNRVN